MFNWQQASKFTTLHVTNIYNIELSGTRQTAVYKYMFVSSQYNTIHQVKRFRRYGRKLTFEDLTLHYDPDLDDRNPTFLHDTPGHGDAPQYQVWLHSVQWFGRYLPDKGVTHGKSDSNIPSNISP